MPEDIQDKKPDLTIEKEKAVIDKAEKPATKTATGSFGGNCADNEKGDVSE